MIRQDIIVGQRHDQGIKKGYEAVDEKLKEINSDEAKPDEKKSYENEAEKIKRGVKPKGSARKRNP